MELVVLVLHLLVLQLEQVVHQVLLDILLMAVAVVLLQKVVPEVLVAEVEDIVQTIQVLVVLMGIQVFLQLEKVELVKGLLLVNLEKEH